MTVLSYRLPGRTVELILLAKRTVHCTVTARVVINTLLVDCAVKLYRRPGAGAGFCTYFCALVCS
jgi:hypothetical protein